MSNCWKQRDGIISCIRAMLRLEALVCAGYSGTAAPEIAKEQGAGRQEQRYAFEQYAKRTAHRLC